MHFSIHGYLPAIGFSQIKKKSQFRELMMQIQASPDKISRIAIDEDSCFVIISKEIAPGIGITLCGEEDEEGDFQIDYYYPYFMSDVYTSGAECTVQRESGREAYNGICDDPRLEMNLIFFVNNLAVYSKTIALGQGVPDVDEVNMSGLSINGKVLLPTRKTTKEEKRARYVREKGKQKLLEAAKKGDQSAIDTLTMNEINLSNRVGKLITSHDIYTLVDSYIMPYGVECDKYSVLGNILSVKSVRNCISNEELYQMSVECNGVRMEVVINSADLMGVPKEGCRFKGDIWLQGNVKGTGIKI